MKFLGKVFVCLLLIATGYLCCKYEVFEIIINLLKEYVFNCTAYSFKF